MAEKKIRDLGGNEYRSTGKGKCLLIRNTLYLEYKNLLMNAVKISNVSYVDETLIKDNLIECGCVGYDKITNEWSQVYGEGVDRKGNPTTLNFVFRNGTSFVRKASYDNASDGAYKINATPNQMPLGVLIMEACDKIANADIAIKQNLDACKTPFVAVAKSKDIQLSLEKALEDKEEGKPAIIVSGDLGEALKGIDFNTEFIVNDLVQYQTHERDLLLNKLGIMSANTDKRERVQVGEVNATVGQCVDYIYLMIDTFNRQCEDYGINVKMSMNGALEDLYTNEGNNDEEIIVEEGEENE